jgi:hypothetical protein
MLSKIKVEVDFDHNNEPIIEILYRQSDDVRDKLIKSFFEKLKGISAWCEIFCANAIQETDVNYAVQRWIIKPIGPGQIEESATAMAYQSRMLNSTPHNPEGVEMPKPDEYVCFELRDEKGEFFALDIFRNGVRVHTWYKPR